MILGLLFKKFDDLRTKSKEKTEKKYSWLYIHFI